MVKRKNCIKETSYNCGASCISAKKVCKIDGLQGQSISILSRLKAALAAANKPSPQAQTATDSLQQEVSGRGSEKLVVSDKPGEVGGFDDQGNPIFNPTEEMQDKMRGATGIGTEVEELISENNQRLGGLNSELAQQFNDEMINRVEEKMNTLKISKPEVKDGVKGIRSALNKMKEESAKADIEYYENMTTIGAENSLTDDDKSRYEKAKQTLKELGGNLPTNQIVPFSRLTDVEKLLSDQLGAQRLGSHKRVLQEMESKYVNIDNNIVPFKRQRGNEFAENLEDMSFAELMATYLQTILDLEV